MLKRALRSVFGLVGSSPEGNIIKTLKSYFFIIYHCICDCLYMCNSMSTSISYQVCQRKESDLVANFQEVKLSARER